MGWFLGKTERVRRQAARWVARRKGGDLTPGEEQEFGRWRRASPRHAQAYDRLEALWELAATATPASSPSGGRSKAPRFATGRQLALAASLFALAVLGAAVLLGARATPSTRGPVLLASAIGEIVPFTLADGSKIVLDTRSKVLVDCDGEARRFALIAGRARFIVAREARPFAVKVAGRELVATASTFDVSLIDREPQVRLLDGSLDVRGIGWTRGMPVLRLRAGDDVRLARSGPTENNGAARTGDAWPRRMLQFRATPLADAVRLVNRYSHRQVRLAQPSLGNRRISGAYHAGDAEAFAQSVAVAFGLALRRGADGAIVLSERGRT